MRLSVTHSSEVCQRQGRRLRSWLMSPLAGLGIVLGLALSASPVSADIEAAFRDFPDSVRRGDLLTIRVDAPEASTCDGAITFNGGVIQNLESRLATGGQCRWDLVVPGDARRGRAEVSVLVKLDLDQTNLLAGFEVLRGAEQLDVSFREFPASARRGESIDIRLNVPEEATCEGTITYRDDSEQTLESQGERRDQCRWEIKVPDDARRGTAMVRVQVKEDDAVANLTASFQVGRTGNEEAEVPAAFLDLPSEVQRDDAMTIRLIVPSGTTCQGDIIYRDDKQQMLAQLLERQQECRWDAVVPRDAARGTAELKVLVENEGDQSTLYATFAVIRRGESLNVSFEPLPSAVRRGDEFDLRVNVPDDSRCGGTITYQDGDEESLDDRGERRDQCGWTIGVPGNARRGTATVRVIVTQDDAQGMIATSFEVVGQDAVTIFLRNVADTVKQGDMVSIRAIVVDGVSCDGSITYADNTKQSLDLQNESREECRWNIKVLDAAMLGRAAVEVKATKGADVATATTSFMVQAK